MLTPPRNYSDRFIPEKNTSHYAYLYKIFIRDMPKNIHFEILPSQNSSEYRVSFHVEDRMLYNDANIREFLASWQDLLGKDVFFEKIGNKFLWLTKTSTIIDLESNIIRFLQTISPEVLHNLKEKISAASLFPQKELKKFLSSNMVSYASGCEDIILFKFLHSVKIGFYVDIGCAHPVSDSVTKMFYDTGWSGINIDARHEAMEIYKTKRSRDINCCVGVSDEEGLLTFWSSGQLSTFDKATVERLRRERPDRQFTETSMQITTLNKILDRHHPDGEIHFLKIDVEHYEKQVIQGIDLTRYRPWMIAVESTHPCTMIPTNDEWEYLLTDNSYTFVTQHSVNRYYAANEKKYELLHNFHQKPVVPYITNFYATILKRMYSYSFRL